MSEDPSNPVTMYPSTPLALPRSEHNTRAHGDDRAIEIGRKYRALSVVLAAHRPASYSDLACSQWLDAAFELLDDLAVDVLEQAALEAGNKCRWPSDIVPTIREHANAIIAARDRQRRLAAPLQVVEGWQGMPRTWWRPSPEEMQAAKEEDRALWQAGHQGLAS